MTITVITTTCDRPIGIALAERMMQRQTYPISQWIVADGGETPAPCSMGQVHLHQPRPPGVENFIGNLLAGLHRATGDVIAFIEDDDWYAPTHLEQLVRQLHDEPRAIAAGDDDQRYYNVATRQWRTWKNVGACLCQTMMRREWASRFEQVAQTCLARSSYGVDGNFWRGIPLARRSIVKAHTVVGIKGLPGRHGLGVGHRPDAKWTDDPNWTQLRAWIGDDSAQYESLSEGGMDASNRGCRTGAQPSGQDAPAHA